MIEVLCRTLNYQFKDINLLKQALTHRSKRKNHNERLEFLGDSVLGCVIAEAMYDHFPKADEGTLSRYKISLVNGKTLSELARELNLGEYIQLGVSEIKSGGHQKSSILEDAMEAIIGAIYLDSNYETARQCVRVLFSSRIDRLLDQGIPKDAKSQLQEYCHKQGFELPEYTIDRTEGEVHSQTVYITCTVPELNLSAQAFSLARKKAEQLAAQKVLDQIPQDQQNNG